MYGLECFVGFGKDVLEVVVVRGLGGEIEKWNWFVVNYVEV